uniref:Spindle and centriole-associated protein 1 n=1 Tax=Pogona vitticeps TaxID=103695 RepID=A0A6J0T9G8_9SAUR
MSLWRVSRFPTGTGRKPPKARRKKTPAKQEWDSTIHDLTVHRATPEDIALRHERHKSKNKALVHLELQEKALKSKWKKQRLRAPESLEKKKLALMKEIMSDQYQLQDVLERSDQALAVVKDLFGDAPHRQLGFPNVTVAPDYDVESSQGPIIQKCDPPTQLSILSESVMDPQALNEAEECPSVCKTNGENGVHLKFRSNIDTKRMLHLLNEENSVDNCEKEASKQHVTIVSSHEGNVLLTPAAVWQSLGGAALNATNAVKKVHSRLENEEQTPGATYIVQQILNAKVKKQKQTSTKVKKKQISQTPTGEKINLSTAAASSNLPNGNRTSLEVLNQMIEDMEHEMEEYERWMGYEIHQTHRSQGVSGFTPSLVNALCRMLCYLKESETRVRQEVLNRKKLEEEISEHRALIDALTAEVLLMREENLAMQNQIQQCLVEQKKQPPACALKELSIADSDRMTNPRETGDSSIRGPESTQVKPLSNSVGLKTDMYEFLQVDLSCDHPELLNPPDKNLPVPLVSPCLFQPAILLSPPQQSSSQDLPLLPQNESLGKEPDGEQRPSASHIPFTAQEESSPPMQRDGVPVPDKPSQSSLCSNGQPVVRNFPAAQRGSFGDFPERFFPAATLMCTRNDDLQEHIAEFTFQNSAIKSQLRKLRHCHQETSSSLQQPVTMQDGAKVEGQGNGQAINRLKELPKSMDERIAELSRQSAEARGKLLLLTNQQKLPTFVSVSPPVSPIPSTPVNVIENGRRTIEVSVPVAETLDNSEKDTGFPASENSARRGASHQTAVVEDIRENRRKQDPIDLQGCLPRNISLGNVQLTGDIHKTKGEKRKEEGWFALSTHLG